MKYIEQTEYALYELSEKITDFPKEKSRKFCSLIFQVSMHDLLLKFTALVVVYTLRAIILVMHSQATVLVLWNVTT